jgi:hypothetical protein
MEVHKFFWRTYIWFVNNASDPLYNTVEETGPRTMSANFKFKNFCIWVTFLFEFKFCIIKSKTECTWGRV